jgi:CPA1 family monovalent cation:H+ antiporter
MFDIAIICLVLTAVLAYLNHRYVGLPTTIGVMSIALLLSIVLVALDKIGVHALRNYEVSLLSAIDLSDVLMRGMLSILLFAGALHVNLNDLTLYKWQIGFLSVLGTIVSTLLVGTTVWLTLPVVGIGLPLSVCLLFGALISPTDPIAVMGIVKAAGAPKKLELVIAGESLFNDGVGVVLFSFFLAMLADGHTPTLAHGGTLLVCEVGGGIIFGLTLGYFTYRLLKSIDNYQVEILITLAAVLGGYSLAHRLHVSGPLAMVVAGLLIGNQGRSLAMSDKTREHLDMFWELLDEILNAVLFMILGLEIMLISFAGPIITAIPGIIIIVIGVRLLTVGTPVFIWKRFFQLPQGSWKVLTWGGLRGGISVAMALSLPTGPFRDVVLALTYGVVVFSIIIQGLTIGHVIRVSMPESG